MCCLDPPSSATDCCCTSFSFELCFIYVHIHRLCPSRCTQNPLIDQSGTDPATAAGALPHFSLLVLDLPDGTSPCHTGHMHLAWPLLLLSFIFLLALTWRWKATYGGAGGQCRTARLGSFTLCRTIWVIWGMIWLPDLVNTSWRWYGNTSGNYAGATIKWSDFRATLYQWRINPTFSTAKLK